MAYLGDPRFSNIQENGTVADGCGKKDDYYKWNGMYSHHCGFDLNEFSQNVFYTKSLDDKPAEDSTKYWALLDNIESGTTSGFTETNEAAFTVKNDTESDKYFVFDFVVLKGFKLSIGGQPIDAGSLIMFNSPRPGYTRYVYEDKFKSNYEYEIKFEKN